MQLPRDARGGRAHWGCGALFRPWKAAVEHLDKGLLCKLPIPTEGKSRWSVILVILQCQTSCMASFSSPSPFSGISSVSNWREILQFFHFCPGVCSARSYVKKNQRIKKGKKHGSRELPWGQHKSWGKAECGNLLSDQQGPAMGSCRWRCWGMLGYHPGLGCYVSQPALKSLFWAPDGQCGHCLGLFPWGTVAVPRLIIPLETSALNGQTAAACNFHLPPLNFTIKNETNPHLSLPLAYQVLWFLSPLPLK